MRSGRGRSIADLGTEMKHWNLHVVFTGPKMDGQHYKAWQACGNEIVEEARGMTPYDALIKLVHKLKDFK